MGKLVKHQKKDVDFIVYTLSNDENMNQREYEFVARGSLKQHLPIQSIQRKKQKILQYSVQGKVSLHTYLQGVMTKKAFLHMIHQLLEILKIGDIHKLNIKNYMLANDYIYIDLRTKELFLLYVPVINATTGLTLAEFFKSLPFCTIFHKYEDCSYVKEYLAYFQSEHLFSLQHFEQYILRLMGKEEAGGNDFTPSHELSKKLTNQAIHHDHSKAISYIPPVSEKLVPHNRQEKDIVSAPMMSETTVLGYDTEVQGTMVLNVDTTIMPYLVREVTQEKIFVDKDVFRLGKEKRECDYAIVDNQAVSRRHADIITRNHRYFIYDHCATNKTYVDGKEIDVQVEIEIYAGTKVRLANEEFTFYI